VLTCRLQPLESRCVVRVAPPFYEQPPADDDEEYEVIFIPEWDEKQKRASREHFKTLYDRYSSYRLAQLPERVKRRHQQEAQLRLWLAAQEREAAAMSPASAEGEAPGPDDLNGQAAAPHGR